MEQYLDAAVRALKAEVDSRKRFVTSDVIAKCETYSKEPNAKLHLLKEVMHLVAGRHLASAGDAQGILETVAKLDDAGLHRDAQDLRTASRSAIEDRWRSAGAVELSRELCRLSLATAHSSTIAIAVAAARASTARVAEIGAALGPVGILEMLAAIASKPAWARSHEPEASALASALLRTLGPMAETLDASQVVAALAACLAMPSIDDDLRAAARALFEATARSLKAGAASLDARQVLLLASTLSRISDDEGWRKSSASCLVALLAPRRDYTEGQAAELIGRVTGLPLDDDARATAKAFVKEWTPRLSPEMDPFAVVGVIQAVGGLLRTKGKSDPARQWVGRALAALAREPGKVKKRSRLFLLASLGSLGWSRDASVEALVGAWGTEIPASRGDVEDRAAAALESFGYSPTRTAT